MTVLIDRREGSKDLAKPLAKLGLDVEVTTLDAADVAWVGAGPGGEPWLVGVEVKTVGEMVRDLVEPRFSGDQLRRLQQGYDACHLVVWGAARANPHSGYLEVTGKPKGPSKSPWQVVKLGRRPVTYTAFWKHLWTLTIKTGLQVVHVTERTGLYHQLKTLVDWWQAGWDHHESHQRHYRRPDREGPVLDLPRERLLAERVAKELPGVGAKRALAAAKQFRMSTWELIHAGESAWCEVPGIGPRNAKRIVEAIRGGANGS